MIEVIALDQLTNERVLQVLINNHGKPAERYPDAIQQLSDLTPEFIRASLSDLASQSLVQLFPGTTIPGISGIPYARVTDFGLGYFRRKAELAAAEQKSEAKRYKEKWEDRKWNLLASIIAATTIFLLKWLFTGTP